MKQLNFFFIVLINIQLLNTVQLHAQGTWTSLTNTAPHANYGGMILLSDGTVLVKTSGGGGSEGYIYDKLTPNADGSYVNGTWSSIAPMISSRTYYSSQLLKDGRLYVCGGEYGSGGSSGEVYNPLTNSWTGTPSPGGFVSDANSEILEDGRVLQNIVGGGATMNRIYDPATNTYSNGPTSLGSANESAWIKLPDNSILFININSTQAERYIPATNTWILDQPAPLNIYVQPGSEMGGALLLPDGRAMFIGGTGKTLFYTPSGSTANGTWTIGPDLPSWNIAPFISLPLGVSDGPCAMMVNGKVLLALAQVASIGDTFPDPTLFYTFDPITNQYTQIPSPTGTLLGTINMPTYHGNMLALPNGKILFGHFGSTQYYEFTPTGSPLNSGKPSITSIAQINANTYRLIGTKFNGISQGASYGDDWQMSTNYPIVRISYGTNVFYCRTYNWNSTGVQRGSMADTTYFTVPAGIPITAYNLVVTANGIPSDPIIFNPGFVAGVSVTAGTGVCKGVSTSFIANPVNGGNPGYQWQLNGNNIAGATNSTYTTSTLNSYDQIRCVMTSNIPGIGGNPTTSNPVSIPVHENTAAIQTTLTPTAICRGNNITLTASKEYSIPPYTGGTIYGDNISGVTINGNAGSVLGNYSFGAPSPFYTFYTYSWSGLQANNEYSMNVSMNNSVTSNNSLAAWLDFNQDKSFDPSERILFGTGFSSAYAQLNGTFKVPANAVNGNTRMRVRLVSGNANNNPNAIENFGETEDYLLTITGGSGTIAPTSFDWLANTSPSFGAVVSSTPAYSQQYNVKTTDAYGCYTSVQTTPVLVTDLNIDATVSPAILCPGATASLNAGVDTNYCMPTYTSGGTMMGNYIANLDLYDFSTPFLPIHLMSNFSGASLSPYYTIFPAAGNTTATLNTGGNYTFYFQSGSAAGNVIAAFIDYDQNGDLNPGMEKLGEISIGSNTTGSLTFTVPGWARNGSTRLRIILSTTTNMSSCNPYLSSYSYGETEDYTIQISGGMINTLPTITWSPSTNPSSGNLVNASPSASTTYTVTATDNSGCSSTALAHVLVHTPSPFTVNPASPASICAGETTTLSVTANPVTYCQPAYTFGSGSGDYISSVYLFNPLSTTLSNSSGASASPYYTLYPASGSATTTLTAGYTYYLTVNVGSFSSFNNVAAWIDYNGDGQWFAPMEKLGETGDINSAFGSGTLIFTVPSWAKNGTLRLRIREVYSTYNLDPCATYPYGETEDYSLTITGGISASSTTYAWSPATSPSSGTSVMASPSSNTIYTVTATGSYGCTSTGTSAVTMKTDALFYQNASSVCVSSPVSFTANPNTCSGNAFQGNGNSYGASLLNSFAITATNNFTMEAWVKWNGSTGSNQYIFYNGHSASNGYGIFINAANANKLSIQCGGVGIANSSVALTPGLWQHIAITRGGPVGGTWRLYLDGVQATLTNQSVLPFIPNTGGTYVGRNSSGSEYLNGAVDEFRIWSTAISAFLIPNERVACIPSPQTNLVGYWQFNEGLGSGTACTDASGGGRTLMLSHANARTTTASYLWNFGDATTGTGITTSHQFPASGNYTTTLTVNDITGCTATSNQLIYINPCITNLNLSVYFQGYHMGSGFMTTVLANQGVSISLMNVDSVTIELHDVMPPYSMLHSSHGIVQVYGNVSCSFPFNVSGSSYYIVVKHRNGIETWSNFPVFVSPTTFYSFSNAASQAYGNNLVQILPGLWAIYSGDFNQDGNIDLLDASSLELDINNFSSGYFNTDINGDGNVDLLDIPVVEENVNNFISTIRP